MMHALYASSDQESNFKLLSFIVGTIIAVLIVPGIKEFESRKIKKYTELNKTLLDGIRKSLSFELGRVLLSGEQIQDGIDLKLNIRIFLPARRSLFDIYHKRKYYVMKDYPGLHVKQIDKIKFQVSPEPKKQGLVGLTFNKRQVSFDFNLDENHANSSYNLEANQLEITNYCNFAITGPIFKTLSKDLEAIVSFDSDVKIEEPTNNDWKEVVRTSCKIINEIHKKIK